MNIATLKKAIEGLDDDTPCSYDLWLPDDVEALVEDLLIPGEALTDDEIEETLNRVYKLRDCTVGTTWNTLLECLPESTKDKMV